MIRYILTDDELTEENAVGAGRDAAAVRADILTPADKSRSLLCNLLFIPPEFSLILPPT